MLKLAIVIPYFKLDFFERSLKSLANQTNKNFVVYIGNDNSPADPLPLIKRYAEYITIKYVRFADNLGGRDLVGQWTRCIELMSAQEEWFMILGDDDYLSNNYVAEFYRNIAEKDAFGLDVLKFRSVIVSDKDVVRLDSFNKEMSGVKESIELFMRKIHGKANSSLSEHVFRLSKFRSTGFTRYPMAWHTDDMLLLNMSSFGKILFVNTAICYVREFDNSISGSDKYAVQKAKAGVAFYTDLLNRADVSFSEAAKLKFLYSIEYCCKKINAPLEHGLTNIYFKNGLYKEMLKFVVRKGFYSVKRWATARTAI